MRRQPIAPSFLTAALLATALFTGPVVGRAADLPTGESIMDKAAQKTGSKEAVTSAKSIVLAGTVVVEGRNIEGPVSVWQEDGKIYTAIEFPGIGKVEEGFDGSVAWELNALQGARIKTGEERAATVRGARINVLASWKEEYKSARTLGEATVNGRPTWKIELTPNEGRSEVFYIDKENFLPLRVSQIQVSPVGDLNVDVLFSDYREIDGIQTPFIMKQQVAGQVMAMHFSKISYTEKIPAGRFDLPAAVKAILANQKK